MALWVEPLSLLSASMPQDGILSQINNNTVHLSGTTWCENMAYLSASFQCNCCIGCIGHDLCRKLRIAFRFLHALRLMLGGMAAQYHTVKNKFYNFHFCVYSQLR